ncbi:MAG: alpha/beta hydrolase [Solirubrobacterales bacterium]
MPVAMKNLRAQVWMESLGEWSWPGQRTAAVEMLPPAWVPAFPPRLEPAASPAAPVAGAGARRVLITALLSSLLAVCGALALQGRLGLTGISPSPSRTLSLQSSLSSEAPPLPTLTPVSQDTAGSSIDGASYSSPALHGHGSFLVYLPAGYASTTRHYPVLYLLHGNNQPASAFLQIGLQDELDRLVAHHVIPPLIAVMIQGGRGANNWRNTGSRHYESYVLEVQELIDRMLPTVASRSARAIAGDSMGGYGAMNIALSNPYRFATVESWLGFFNGLEGKLQADRPLLSRIGLHAFVYGGESDQIADPSENAPFAAALRRAGASAKSAVYPGGHSLETLQEHLSLMLTLAGDSLSRTPAPLAGPRRARVN